MSRRNGMKVSIRKLNGHKSREKKPHKPSKYKNKKTIIDDIVFASLSEAQHYVNLKEMKLKGDIVDFQMQVPFELVPGWTPPWDKKKIRAMTYVSDFVVQFPDGHEEVQDVKGSRGFQTPEFKLKKKVFEWTFKRPLKIVTVKVSRQ